jgi:hypothetical protein
MDMTQHFTTVINEYYEGLWTLQEVLDASNLDGVNPIARAAGLAELLLDWETTQLDTPYLDQESLNRRIERVRAELYK